MNFSSPILWILIIVVIVVLALVVVAGYSRYKRMNMDAQIMMGSSEAVRFKKLRLDDNLIENIKDSKKTIDVRRDSPLVDDIKKGDPIHYFSGRDGQDILVKVTDKKEYDNIDKLLEKEKFEKIYPDEKDIDDKKLMFLKSEVEPGGKGYYSKEELSGKIVAFHIELIFPPYEDKKKKKLSVAGGHYYDMMY